MNKRPEGYYRPHLPYHIEFKDFGGRDRIHAWNPADLQDAYVNVVSGDLYFDDHSFCGHQVMFLTGEHVEDSRGGRTGQPKDNGNDIYVEECVWIASRTIIIASKGPRIIGHHASVGAGSVVTKDVPPYAFVAGNPAKFIRWVNKPKEEEVLN